MPNRIFWWCEKCKGRSATFGLLRQDVPDEIVNRLWNTTKAGNFSYNRNCPSCRKLMAEVPMRIGKNMQVLDVCTTCQFVWFDYGEFATLQNAQVVPIEISALSNKSEQKIQELKTNFKKVSSTAKATPTPENKTLETKIKLDKFKKTQKYIEKNQTPKITQPKVLTPTPSKKIVLREKVEFEFSKKLEPESKKNGLSPEGISRPEKDKKYQPGKNENQKNKSLPPSNWEFTPGVLGLPIEKDAIISGKGSWLTWAIAVFISVFSLFSSPDLEKNINTIGLSHDNFSKYGVSIIFKSFLVQSNIWLLLINMYFFIIFGSFVEEFIGKFRFLILLVLATLFGDLLHILAATPTSSSFIGASGGITGLMAFYVWRFPRSKIDLLFGVTSLPNWSSAPAYAFFMFWLMLMFFGITGLAPILSHLSLLSILGGITVGVTYWFFSQEAKL